jgi:acyl dehydratase
MAFSAVREWKFLAPCYVGDTVHVVTEVLDTRPRGRRAGQVIWKRQLINQAGEVLQEGFFETLVALAHTAASRTAVGKIVEPPAAEAKAA